jgi:two-component system, LytTR family, sensor kinase
MGQTRQIMDDNDRNARFQTQMEAEENAFRHWVEGNDGNAREELEARIRETTDVVENLTEKKNPAKPEVYRSLWAIEKSYEVYCVKRDEVMEMDRSKAEFSRALYEIYDMQGFLIQYGGNLTQAVMKEGNNTYLQGENRFKLIPLVVVFAAVMIAGIAVYAGKYIDRSLIEPIVALSREAERVAANDFEGQLPGYDQDDEMGHLLKAFGKMKESTQESLRTIQENSELQIQLEKVQLQMLKSQPVFRFLFFRFHPLLHLEHRCLQHRK